MECLQDFNAVGVMSTSILEITCKRRKIVLVLQRANRSQANKSARLLNEPVTPKHYYRRSYPTSPSERFTKA